MRTTDSARLSRSSDPRRVRVPFAFMTGYDAAALPERFRGRPLIRKPYNAAKLTAMLGGRTAAAKG